MASNDTGRTVTNYTAVAGISGVIGYLADADGFVIVKWLASYLGALGFVGILFSGVLATGWYLTFTYFADQKHEDEARWDSRFQDLRSDVKEAFGIVASLTEKVTILTERVKCRATDTRTSARE